jgi:hypothetical protein
MSNFTQVHIYWVFLSTIICILIVPREREIGGNLRWGDEENVGEEGEEGEGKEGEEGGKKDI